MRVPVFDARRFSTIALCSVPVLGVLLCPGAVPVCAQDAWARHGVWGDLGLGYGLASFSCDSCSHAPLSGFVISGHFGVTPNPHVRLGLGLDGWENGLHTGKLPTIEMWTVLLSYYPRTAGGPYIEAGAGLSHYGLEHGRVDPLESVSNEPAYAAAMGWGYTLGVGVSFVRVTYAHGSVGTLYGGGTGSNGWKQNVLLVELAGRWPP